MALRKVVKDGDPVLLKICKPVEKFDARLHELLDDMKDTMYEADGVGLAAPQVGVMRRAVVIDTGDGYFELVNPEILEVSEETQYGVEGCLSFPGLYGYVTRPLTVKFRAQDRNGEVYEMEVSELFARCVCHELNHLDGIVLPANIEAPYEDEDEDEE
ncbi:MAG: peptide deformylase [Oscillospiraceae bacterium]|nr:peptide deformylase [Oscillospiraceae bacterium]